MSSMNLNLLEELKEEFFGGELGPCKCKECGSYVFEADTKDVKICINEECSLYFKHQ